MNNNAFRDPERVRHELDERYDSNFYIENFFEYEQGKSEPIVRGRMKTNIEFWRSIKAPNEIINVIESGYRLPFLNSPPPASFKNNKSARDNPEFVSEAILDLLDKNLIVELDYIPDYVNPLSVSIHKSGKKRLILDLRYVNKFLWKQNKTKSLF